MKLYAVLFCISHEGESLEAIFDSEEKAKLFIEKSDRTDHWEGSTWYEIKELELNTEYL